MILGGGIKNQKAMEEAGAGRGSYILLGIWGIRLLLLVFIYKEKNVSASGARHYSYIFHFYSFKLKSSKTLKIKDITSVYWVS